MQVAPIGQPSATPGASPTSNAASSDQATSAFGLSFESLLRIILTQLTYQDPLKPIENFEFVSQLAQFSQIQIGQTGNDRLGQLVSAQGASQATGLLGRRVDLPTGTTALSGKVSAVTFQNGDARVTIETDSGQTISNVSIANISQIREGE